MHAVLCGYMWCYVRVYEVMCDICVVVVEVVSEYVWLGLCMVRGVCVQWYMVYNERHV